LAAVSGHEQAAGYAVPVDDVFRRILDALKQGREVEYGFLGVRPENLDDSERLLGKFGARIEEVVLGTPAHRFGLSPGDLITHVNGRAIPDADALVLEVSKQPAAAPVRLSVASPDGRARSVHVELAKSFVGDARIVTDPGPSWRGLRVDFSTATRGFRQRLLTGEVDLDGCVAVCEVQPDTPAAQAGLKVEQCISHVGGTRVTTPGEFLAAVGRQQGPVELRVSAGRGKSTTVHVPRQPAEDDR
jgi:S1-C subfamily serine protease